MERRPLEGVVERAAVVARVKILDVAPALLSDGQPCGYKFKAEVVEAYKGEDKELVFFALSDADFEGFDRQYLLVAYKRTDDQTRQLHERDSTLEPAAAEKASCALQEPYFVKAHIQMLIPFSSPDREGKEWLRSSRTSIVSENRFEHEILGDPESEARRVRWTDVEAIIKQAVSTK